MNKAEIKILFMGTPFFAAKALEKLVREDFNVVGLICQPDKEVGRGKKIIEPETKVLAKINNIPVYQPLNKNELFEYTKKINPDIIIVAAYGKIIPKSVLDIPKFGSLNIHGSILPKFRGSSCIAQSILEGDKSTGITIMEVSEEMDAGDIISTVEIPITENDTTESLTLKLAEAGANEITNIVPAWIDCEAKACKQCHTEATYCKLIKKEDGRINWSKSASKIERMTRAYYPWPTAFTTLDGKLLKIISAKVVDLDLNPGKISIKDKNMYVGTGNKSLEITKIQIEGKKEATVRDFLNGYSNLNEKTLV